MDKIKQIIKDNRYLLLLLYLPIYLAAFFIIDNMDVPHFIIRCGIDSYIPFCEYFIIPYALWFVWFPGVVVFFMWHALRPYIKNDSSEDAIRQSGLAKDDFIKLCLVMFTSMTLSLIFYIIFPNGIDLREPIEQSNLCAKAVEFIRAADTPYGVCPSIHVATIIAEALVIKDSKLKALTPVFKITAYIITLLIAYSTMAVKQHSIIDVISGTLLAAVLYYLYILKGSRNERH